MSSNRWFIVTNTENLEFFFGCGLIVDKQGFTESAYIADAMCDTPAGYIPCFPESNLWNALIAAKAEDENLTECLLELDIKKIKTKAFFRTEAQEPHLYNSFRVDGDINSDDQTLSEILLPAPLPINSIKKIIIKNSSGKNHLTTEYQSNYGSTIKSLITTNTKLFKEPKPTGSDLPLKVESNSNSISEQVSPRTLNYDKAFSYGGALSLLYYQTKNGTQSTKIFKDFISNNSDSENLKNIVPLLNFFFNQSGDLDETFQLYSQIIQCIYGISDAGEARFSVLDLLSDIKILPDSYANNCAIFKESLTSLIERTHQDDTDTIITNVIGYCTAKKSGRSKIFLLLTMFFVRDNSETMLKYYHNDFSEEDYALLALFFGAVNGFINTPNIIRKIHDLSTWVSFKMAEYIHRLDQDHHSTFDEPKCPALIYEKFFKQKSTNNKLHDFYESFAKHLDILVDDFITWTITTKGKYTQEGATMEFKSRQKQSAEVDFNKLEELMTVKTIKKANELLDFNKIIDTFNKKS
ncbi:hypothetical protein [Endozoicomonas euniceicola]|uniref:Uncharacterized protein n=1 Tax=Endozoicomonas euniceicola TaxID=1234143 RepID=A0ABY6GTX8_9GAMM|nr:hypothetical protein [Endozoicomonas euniceicola]UYM16237.1 hypothetical protein NX720_26145 [Endozoicomonas euniceicola]